MKPASLVSICYVSSAIGTLDPVELVTILGKAREKNLKLGVTGILLYKDGNFMQAIEGPPLIVESLYAVILNDSRHKGMLRLLTENISERQFPNWSMEFKNLQDVNLTLTPGYRDFAGKSLLSPMFRAKPSAAQQLLASFHKRM